MEKNWEKHDIDISKQKHGKMPCPKCSHTRKNRRDPCLSVDIEKGLFNCHHCGFKGSVVENSQKKEYVKPLGRLEKISKNSIAWFENRRKISNNTLLRFGITEATEWMPSRSAQTACICFNYFRDGELVNIKFRDDSKGFKMSKDAELIFYNLDAIKDESTCIIVEGEIDCLSLYESGIYNGVSVPNGASKGNQKLEYLNNCWSYFEEKEKIILAVDNDEAGNALRDELARRLGKEKCYTVEYPPGCKDMNEVLVLHGKQAVAQLVELARPLPLEGIMTMDEIHPIFSDWYSNGYPKGADCKIPGFNDLLTFAPGQLTLITGIPGHGKDEFTNVIMANLAKHEGWSWGLCDFEETPPQTASKLAEKITGKCFDFRINPDYRMSIEDIENAIYMIDRHFVFINTQEVETNIDDILSKAEQMVKRYGIKGFRLNPWNWIESTRPAYMSETEFISGCLSKIILFARKFGLHFILVAHTTKMPKGTDGKYVIPTLYSINGSANFFNKCHNGLTVYRDIDTNVVNVYVQKVKQSWLGKVGYCSFKFDTYTRQYIPIDF